MADTKKYFYNIDEFTEEILKSKNTFGSRGWDTGFPVLDEILSYKRGASSLIYSYAHQGKTQYALEASCYLAKRYGVISAMYLTEAGSKGEAVLDIVQTYLGKQAADISDDELFEALEWAKKYFYIADVSARLANVVEIYQGVKQLKESGVDVGNVIIDHFHNITKHQDQNFMDRADITKFVLQQVTRASAKLNVHTFILFHVRDTSPVKCDKSGIWYLPQPEGYAISGGQQAGYLAQNMISVWRPISREDHYGVINPQTGAPYELNECYITCTKVKPKGTATLGRRVMYFDVSKQRYYCVKDGRRYYAGDYDTTPAPHDKKQAVEKKKSMLDEEDLF